MIALQRSQWNLVTASVLLLGSLFIAVTRVQPAQPVLAATVPPESGAAAAPLPDRRAPDFTLTALDGTGVSLSQFKGQVVLINLWATWCPPCRAEMPTIQRVYEQNRTRGFIVLAVNLREEPSTVNAFMRQRGLTFPALLDTDGQISATYQAYVLPSSFFVDRRGIIRAVYRGPMPRSVIAGTVDQLLREGT